MSKKKFKVPPNSPESSLDKTCQSEETDNYPL